MPAPGQLVAHRAAAELVQAEDAAPPPAVRRQGPGCLPKKGLCDKRFTSAYLYAAVCPASGADFALVMPSVSTAAMSLFLDGFSRNLEPGVQAVLVLDQAGWPGARVLAVPDNVTLVPLPPYSPELNPVERVWLYLRERFLSHRILDDYDAVVQACCDAWNALTATPGRLRSLTSYPWLPCVNA